MQSQQLIAPNGDKINVNLIRTEGKVFGHGKKLVTNEDGSLTLEVRPWTTELTAEEKKFLKLMFIRVTSPYPDGQPFLTPIFFKLIPVSAPGLGTMAVTESWHLLIDFEFAMSKGIEWAGGVLNHEPWHLLLDDFNRYRKLDVRGMDFKSHEVWNLAMDLAINSAIIEAIPDDGCVPGNGAFADYQLGLRGEDYYHQIVNDPDFMKPPPPPESNGGGGEADDQSSQQAGSGSGGSSIQTKLQGGEGSGSGEGQQQGGASGQGQSGQQLGSGSGGRNEFQAPEDTTICGGGDQEEIKKKLEEAGIEGTGVGEADAEIAKREVATRIKNSKNSIGNDKGMRAALDWAEEYLLEEPVNWKRELRGSVMRVATSAKRGLMDYSYRKQARRQPYGGVIMPGMIEPKLKLVCGIDTSGSNMHNMDLIVGEIVKIASQLRIRGDNFKAFAVDVSVDKMTSVNDPKKVLSDRRMNGGTRMRPAYEYVAGLRGTAKPNVFLLVTDGEVLDEDFPDEAPKGMGGTAVVTAIVLTGKSNDSGNESIVANAERTLAKWSKVIYLYNVGEDE